MTDGTIWRQLIEAREAGNPGDRPWGTNSPISSRPHRHKFLLKQYVFEGPGSGILIQSPHYPLCSTSAPPASVDQGLSVVILWWLASRKCLTQASTVCNRKQKHWKGVRPQLIRGISLKFFFIFSSKFKSSTDLDPRPLTGYHLQN